MFATRLLDSPRRLIALAGLSALVACTFDSTVPDRTVGVPVVICDTAAPPAACPFGGHEFAFIAWLGDLEFFDGSLGAIPEIQGSPIVGSSGCQFEGRYRLYRDLIGVAPTRLLALDEQDWVAECTPKDLFSRDAEGKVIVHGAAVFRRGVEGCVVRSANFCS